MSLGWMVSEGMHTEVWSGNLLEKRYLEER
jgi:hypothetical protein